jgi:ketosteroid isomerase-like protein
MTDSRGGGQPHVTAVVDYYRRIDDGDVDGALGSFAAHARYDRPGYPTLVGVDAIRELYVDNPVVQGGRHQVEQVISSGSDVAVRGSFTGVTPDGTPLHVRFSDFWQFAEGWVVRRYTYFDVPVPV